MPHLVISEQRLAVLRRLVAEWDQDRLDDGEWREESADWAEKAFPMLRLLADPHIELPDVHERYTSGFAHGKYL